MGSRHLGSPALLSRLAGYCMLGGTYGARSSTAWDLWRNSSIMDEGVLVKTSILLEVEVDSLQLDFLYEFRDYDVSFRVQIF